MEEEASGPPEAPKAPEGGAQEQVASPEANTDDNPPPAIKVGDVVSHGSYPLLYSCTCLFK